MSVSFLLVTAGKQGETGRPAREFSLAELAAESEFPERTIRYYISRGLVPAPARGGRDAFYTGEHLERLREIRRAQRQGLTLTEIERMAGIGTVAKSLPEPEAWLAYSVAPDITVQVRAGASPWRTKQLRSAIERLVRDLSATSPTEDEES